MWRRRRVPCAQSLPDKGPLFRAPLIGSSCRRRKPELFCIVNHTEKLIEVARCREVAIRVEIVMRHKAPSRAAS
jgi:hypothetical protein